HLGSGNVPCHDPFVISVDVLPLPNVDLVAEAEHLPFAGRSVSFVESGAVFEHVYDPMRAISEVRRILVDGGHLVIDTAFMQGYHGFPSHYFNMTSQAVETFLLDDFEMVEADVPPSGSPIYSIENSLRRLLDALPADESARLRSMTIDRFLAECSSALKSPAWFSRLDDYIKRALAASFKKGGRKPLDYDAAIAAMTPEERHHRAVLKRDYYAARMCVIERHFEVLHYRQNARERGGEGVPEPQPLDAILRSGSVTATLTDRSWIVATEALALKDNELIEQRDRWREICRYQDDRSFAGRLGRKLRRTSGGLRLRLCRGLNWVRARRGSPSG